MLSFEINKEGERTTEIIFADYTEEIEEQAIADEQQAYEVGKWGGNGGTASKTVRFSSIYNMKIYAGKYVDAIVINGKKLGGRGENG